MRSVHRFTNGNKSNTPLRRSRRQIPREQYLNTLLPGTFDASNTRKSNSAPAHRRIGSHQPGHEQPGGLSLDPLWSRGALRNIDEGVDHLSGQRHEERQIIAIAKGKGATETRTISAKLRKKSELLVQLLQTF